jgi:hypothetical protein
LKNNIKTFLLLLWSITTEVPGWPDAPMKLRVRRLIPIVAPLVAMLLVFLWTVAWRNPHIRAAREQHRPVIALESEVTSLRLLYSEQQTAEISNQSKEASRALLENPDELPALVDKLKTAARSFEWDANLTPSAAPTPPSPTEAQIYFLPVRGKLSSLNSNSEPFASLLAYLEKLPSADKWIDLTRMSLRADDQGRLNVEVLLRAACQVPHEKTAQ